MRFLANENIPITSVYRLRDAGHDVASIRLESPGIQDFEVLDRSLAERRNLVTFDRDYGDLIFHQGLPSPPGVIYLRFKAMTPEEPAELILLNLLLGEYVFEGQFTVLQRDQVRQRALPE